MRRGLFILALASCGPVAAAPPPAGTAPRAADTARGPEAAWPLLAGARDLDGRPLGDSPVATVVIVFATWCGHCHHELGELATLRGTRDDLRVVGVNFREHEEYDDRGDSAEVRAYVAREAPWLRVIPGDDALFVALGRPPKIPTLYVYAPDGRLAARYDRRQRAMPGAAELTMLLDAI
jgi:thiol-disulfide isomerase/thioredoxin